MTFGALIWLSLAILLGMIEGMTAGLVSVWFAGGAIAAFLTALLGVGAVWQIIVFVVISSVLLACMRSLAQKRMLVETIATNADRILGRLAVVSKPIDNLKATGAVRIDGMEWSARTKDDRSINVGATVKILQIDGVKVVVELSEEPSEPAQQSTETGTEPSEPGAEPSVPAAAPPEPAVSVS